MPLAVYLALAYVAGCLAAPYFPLILARPLSLAAMSILLALAAYFWARRRQGSLLIVLALFFLLGLVAMRLAFLEAVSPLKLYTGEAVRLVGVVAEEPEVRGNRVSYLLRVREAEVKGKIFRGGKVLVTVTSPPRVFSYGDLLSVEGMLSYPSPPGNPGEFDYRSYIFQQKIIALVKAQPGSVTKIGEAPANPLVFLSLKIKERLVKALDSAFTPKESALLKGMIFGERTRIDPLLYEAFMETGLVHILSVSGLHVGFVLGGVLLLSRRLNWSKGVTLLLSFTLLFLYDLMVGLDPPIVRATIMGVLFLLAQYLGRERDWRVALAVAALTVLLANPLALYNVGFQLSFAATWGIFFVGPEVNRWWQDSWGKTKLTALIPYGWFLAVPLGAELGVLPLVAWHYGLVSPVSLLANLLTAPLITVIFAGGFLVALLGALLPFLGQALAFLVSPFIHLFLFLVHLCQQLPYAAVYLSTVPLLAVIFWYPAVWLAVRGGKWRRVGIAGLLALWFLLVLGGGGGKGAPLLRLDFIDVGHGDSIFVRTPAGKSLLVDAGGWPEELRGEKEGAGLRVVRYLWREGVKELDVLVLTHPDEDHCGGAWAVLRRFPVKLVVIPPIPEEGDYARLLQFARAKGAKINYAQGGDSLRLDPAVGIKFLSPFPPYSSDPKTFNDKGLVMRITYGERSFLLTADIEEEGQRSLLRYGSELQSDVLKVPHHGSARVAEEFYQAVKPTYAVISVGERSSLPAPSTLELLQRLGVKVLRTDRDGAVTFFTDGKNLYWKSWREEQRREVGGG
ncbi:DNA internalization-related competence protein ComEC/Rec2 [Ammonifex degensii KC4]|uniref:DNA internalization-related competence protein ComEC/Rec2 n=1 Tax=Ammonifex degensii (strain DSM 10501 / KC4) TaxID=429009 RepID=C9R8F0_AMMDK|nr:DNA internalization-related competence protein ComEC/Rec2 [Ammonifex degensii]ACX52579.1 DNA internalization-related competence protein ComEC/Rec2 [Ammonifex degensii KC4]